MSDSSKLQKFLLVANIGTCSYTLASALDDLKQVYAAIAQCVQRAPLSVEALNLKGLICESRGSLSTAIIAFQLARHIMKQGSGMMNSSAAKQRNIILLNLARVLYKVSQILNTSYA